MSTVQQILLALVGVPLITLFVAYVSRWIASFFFSAREAELVGVTCAIAWMMVGGFRATSAYLIFFGIIGFAIGVYALHRLWRPSRGVGATKNG